LVGGRSAAALSGWLAARTPAWRAQFEIAAIDGFGGYKNAAAHAVSDAVTVMDPFHVVALAGTKLDLCRQRVQQDTTGHRCRTGDPLYRVQPHPAHPHHAAHRASRHVSILSSPPNSTRRSR
jgi:transposase